MKLINIGAAVLNQTPLDWDNNKANIIAAIQQARARGTKLLCLPEMCICGYGCEDAFYSPGLRRMARQGLFELLPETHGIAVTMGLPVLHENKLYNTVCLVADGNILGFAAKQNLARQGLHYEPRWFSAWPPGIVDTVKYGQRDYPLGDIFFELDGIRIGFEICEDAWVAKRPGSNLNQVAIDIVMNPSASHFAFGKYETRKQFVLEGSRAFGVTYIYSNLIGNEAGRVIYDGGALIASCGQMVACGPRLGFQKVHLTRAQIDIDACRMQQTTSGQSAKETVNPERCIAGDFKLTQQTPEIIKSQASAWEGSPHLKEEEFTRAISIALYDYLRKSRSGGFVVSLSGGADSAAVSCLVALMVRLACKEMGMESAASDIHFPNREIRDENAMIRALLTCVYQATGNSSETTRNAASVVARALHAEYLELDVNGFVNGYVAMIEKAIGRPLTWQQDDIALQNIQARVRAPGVWMLANLRNALLLATSNRSEAAVGYATMDGDTCGGLSPIAGIDKAFLRQWLGWLETNGPEETGPIPELACVNQQKPTAELRPLEAQQTDEDDLMPYVLLDAIEEAAIRDKKTPLEVFQMMQIEFTQNNPQQLAQWIKRFFTLWCRNQWKRERYAPSFHVDDTNLDPKTWCRFPILSGGFQQELEALKNFISQ